LVDVRRVGHNPALTATGGPMPIDPELDLRFERPVSCSPGHLWCGSTEPARLKAWFCPLPWTVVECDIDLRPGGAFRTLMQGPAGERHHNTGCILELVPDRRFVRTSALLPGFRPAPDAGDAIGFAFTAVAEFGPAPGGALYRGAVSHRSRADHDTLAVMGFERGWSAAREQFEALS
jgi:uncharacterized protein YndB with AHSA1/START domain